MQAHPGFPHRLRAVDTLPGNTGHSMVMDRLMILMYIYIKVHVEATESMGVGGGDGAARWRTREGGIVD